MSGHSSRDPGRRRRYQTNNDNLYDDEIAHEDVYAQSRRPQQHANYTRQRTMSGSDGSERQYPSSHEGSIRSIATAATAGSSIPDQSPRRNLPDDRSPWPCSRTDDAYNFTGGWIGDSNVTSMPTNYEPATGRSNSYNDYNRSWTHNSPHGGYTMTGYDNSRLPLRANFPQAAPCLDMLLPPQGSVGRSPVEPMSYVEGNNPTGPPPSHRSQDSRQRSQRSPLYHETHPYNEDRNRHRRRGNFDFLGTHPQPHNTLQHHH